MCAPSSQSWMRLCRISTCCAPPATVMQSLVFRVVMLLWTSVTLPAVIRGLAASFSFRPSSTRCDRVTLLAATVIAALIWAT